MMGTLTDTAMLKMATWSRYIPEETIREWQDIVELIARLSGARLGLVMRVVADSIQVFVSSRTENNPYQVGDSAHLIGSGLYCERVIATQQPLLVPNALQSAEWSNNPDIEFNMISYLGIPIRWPCGKPFGTLCVLDDKENAYSSDLLALLEKMRNLIEHHLQLQQARDVAEAANARLRSYFDLPMIGSAVVSVDQGWLEVNTGLCDMLGYSAAELSGLAWAELTHPDDLAVDLAHFNRLIAGEIDSYVLEKRFVGKGGSVIWTLVSMGCIRNEDRSVQYALALLNDITERKRIEAELDQHRHHLEGLVSTRTQALNEQLAQVREQEHLLIYQARLAAMGEMFGNIAHQWRQPLSALALVLGNLQDAEQYHELTPEYLARKIADAHRLINKMSTTISDFRDFFRPDKRAQTFDVSRPVSAALDLMAASLKAHGIAVVTDLGQELWMVGTQNEYSQVILNLLSNAKDAILDRHPDVGQIRVRADRAGDQVRVRVADTGGGIAEEVMARLFAPYVSTKPDGTGIGLHMSKMIVEKGMGGRLCARNLETGAEFTVLTPLAQRVQ